MDGKGILDFYRRLAKHNNREWFAEHKAEYLAVKAESEAIANALIMALSQVDEEIRFLAPKDCIFRIYRDTRFSPDKSPYKNHCGIYLAPRGGKHSPYAGYYLHLQPGESFAVVGVYCPEPKLLRELRQSIIDNNEEWHEIVDDEKFKECFTSLFDEGKLVKVPVGFPKDFADADLLKYKHYCFECPLPDSFFEKKNWLEQVVDIFCTGYPFNRFLNYTIEQFGSNANKWSTTKH